MTAGRLSPAPWHTVMMEDGTVPEDGDGIIITNYMSPNGVAVAYSDADFTPYASHVLIAEIIGGRITLFLANRSYWYVQQFFSAVEFKAQFDIPSIGIGAGGAGKVISLGGRSNAAIANIVYEMGAAITSLHPGSGTALIASVTENTSYAVEAMMKVTAGNIVTCIVVDMANPDIAVHTLTSTSENGERVEVEGIELELGHTYGFKCKVNGGVGYVWQVNVIRMAVPE